MPDTPEPPTPDMPEPLTPDMPEPLTPDMPEPLTPDMPEPLTPDMPEPPAHDTSEPPAHDTSEPPAHDGDALDSDTAGVIAPPPLIFLSTLAGGLVLSRGIGRGSLPIKVRVPVGAAAVAGGASLMRSFIQAFARAKTPFDPYKPSEAIVTDGPYRLTRNPAYLGMTLTYVGICLLSDSPWALAPLPAAVAVIDRGVIAREERYLERKFGAPYLEYKRRVRRWI